MVVKIFIFILLVFYPALLWAACSGSSPTWTCTADSTAAQINTCIGSATAGDTINIGAGSGTWTTTVIITKGLHLKGAGWNSTTITNGVSGYLLQVNPTTQALNAEFEITGFTFNSGDKGMIRLGSDCTDLTTFQTNVNIHHNVFTGSTTTNGNNHYIKVYCMGGAVWKNTFTGADQQFQSNGWGILDDLLYPLIPNVRGTVNALYVEDNIINMVYDAVSSSYIEDSQFAASSIVWRYNTINITRTSGGNPQNQSSAWLDWHGTYAAPYNNSHQWRSAYGHEAYGNHVASVSGDGAFAGWAGARSNIGMVFYNNVTTTGTVANGNFSGEAGCSPTSSEYLRLYNWVNAKNLTTIIVTDPVYAGGDTFTCDGVADYAKLNWNVFQHYTSFDGSAGMGCGSSLPNPSGYAERVAYWVTSQSCSSVAGLVGDVVTNPTRGQITGDLYENQSGAWVKIFTPYAYPHPVSASGGGGHTYAPWRTP
jgi:hypothetical protein